MGIFSDIVSSVSNFAHKLTGSSPDTSQDSNAAPAPESNDKTQQPAPTPEASVAHVDVEAVLKDLASKASTPLNYQTSIVDLLKLLGLDSSLEARRTLADELHYTGDKNDTATMNVWLIKQVYTELAQNGGKIPANWGH
ncbi:DUF3597 family protein [Saccharibacter sp. 17.LH.SD]|uniref:DUF3597 domain-containing protein n=1 Tax=Saccharibacter sp. 17.LH.SD TaxID=2689393 RepID=UPI001370CBA7|nr:DUF3597 domain-containing protein [Saccharibacter sp. 17.LH.SD]MXV45136.1 DUF3597 family protein [Saccharibacter sp. 17.LH.SD]